MKESYLTIDNKLYKRIDYTNRLATLTEVGKQYPPRSGRLKRALLTEFDSCYACGSQENLEAHHLEGVTYFRTPKGHSYQDPEANHSIENGQLLCRKCHRIFH